MQVFPQGVINLASLNVPNVYVQQVPPNVLLNGVPTDLAIMVGSASWGPVNSPVVFGSMEEGISTFGSPKPIKYDLMTAAFIESSLGVTNFRGIRVTDGTDTASTIALLDTSSGIGAYLTGIYTGSVGNSINAVIGIGSSYTSSFPSYKLSVYISGGIPEVFDNIGGSGAVFWQNLVSAVNSGQSTARGPSQIVIASLPTSISAGNVVTAGSYATLPSISVGSPGTGASLSPRMKAVSATIGASGTGYASGDTITLTGGTFTTAIVITVLTVSSGAIATFNISTPGNYTVLPSSPVSQGSTSGSGTGATFNVLWGLLSIIVSAGGTGYTALSTPSVTGGGGTGGGVITIQIGSVTAPDQDSYTLTGGTDGSSGVTSQTLVGDDTTNPRKGMYAARLIAAGSVLILADADDPTYWPQQAAFASSATGESCYVVGTVAAGYQDNISGAATLLQTSGINNYGFKLAQGDWIQINDPFNNVTRYVSPQAFMAATIVTQLPSGSSLNKPMTGIIATQKTAEGRLYSDAELSQIRLGRMDVITRPIPAGNFFGCRLGVNTSSNPLTQTDNYPRMINFLGLTIAQGMGPFVGEPQTPDLRLQAKNSVQTFLMNLFTLGIIGDVNQPGNAAAAFTVILDASNNPDSRVDLGYMQCDVNVSLFSITQYLVVNLNAQTGSISVQASPPQLIQSSRR